MSSTAAGSTRPTANPERPASLWPWLWLWLGVLGPSALGTEVPSGVFPPSPGVPLIGAVSPKSGPVEGGTLLTIDGANFSPNTTVFIGGRAASNVTATGTTRLTAILPASPSQGDVDLVVTTALGSFTNHHAFTYGTPRGTNVTLVTSTGGFYQAVAANGTHLFIGQGSTVQVFDLATRTNPIPVASLILPGLIRDIAVEGNLAVVAVDEMGVQIIDVSNPSAPRRRSSFQTVPWSRVNAVKVSGTLAYLADQNFGLEILDLSRPESPAILSTFGMGLFPFDLALKPWGERLLAVVAAYGLLVVVDVTDPRSPTVVSEMPAPPFDGRTGQYLSVALAGNFAFLGDLNPGVDVIDLSDPSHPARLPRQPANPLSNSRDVTVAADGNTVVLAGNGPELLTVLDVSGGMVTERGHLDWDSQHPSVSRTARATLHDGVAWGAAISGILGVDVTQPDQPQRVFLKEDFAAFQRVAAAGSAVVAAAGRGLNGFALTADALQPLTTVALQANTATMTLVGDVALSADFGLSIAGTRAVRTGIQPGPSFQPLPSAFLENVVASDMEPAGNHALIAGIGNGIGLATNTTIISEVDPTRADAAWLIRSASIPGLSSVYPLQVAGAPEFYVVAFPAPTNGRLCGFFWSSPAPLWSFDNIGFVTDLKLSHGDRYLHVGLFGEYRIYDLASPQSPACVSTNLMQGAPRDFIIEGDQVYLTLQGYGIEAYDITDKAHPRRIRSYHTAGPASGLAKTGDRLVAATYNGGLELLALTDIAPPQVTLTNLPPGPAILTTESALTLGGIAADDSGQVTLVTWRNDRGGDGLAQGTTNWLAPVTNLSPGTNHLEIIAYDSAGNSATATLAVTYTPTPPWVLAPLELTAGTLRFRIAGPPGTNLILQRSPDLIQWDPAGTQTLSAEGTATVEMPAPTDGSYFYRAAPVP